jgi:hypothetical protein
MNAMAGWQTRGGFAALRWWCPLALALLGGCKSLSVNTGYVAGLTAPRYVSPIVTGNLVVGRLNAFVGYSATVQEGAKPTNGPIIGTAIQIAP